MVFDMMDDGGRMFYAVEKESKWKVQEFVMRESEGEECW